MREDDPFDWISCDLLGLFNLRGEDIQFTPLFLAYALVPTDPMLPCVLYVDSDRFHPNQPTVLDHLEEALVQVKSYEKFPLDLMEGFSFCKFEV